MISFGMRLSRYTFVDRRKKTVMVFLTFSSLTIKDFLRKVQVQLRGLREVNSFLQLLSLASVNIKQIIKTLGKTVKPIPKSTSY